MPLNILSLDLDWFNFSLKEDIHETVDDFFCKLKRECVLPRTIYIAKEHQYLYPWSTDLLSQQWKRPRANKITYRKIRVTNIDEHHDFYFLRKIKFDSMSSIVGCGNFFAYMAHEGLLSEYTWILGENVVTKPRKELKQELYRAKSRVLRGFGRFIRIVRQSEAFSVLKNQKFDGFIIVKSPEYVFWKETYAAVDEVLARRFSGYKLQRCQRQREFTQEEKKTLVNNRMFIPS